MMQTPFIHCFRTYSCCYFYDFNTNAIVKVPESIYNYLYEMEKLESVTVPTEMEEMQEEMAELTEDMSQTLEDVMEAAEETLDSTTEDSMEVMENAASIEMPASSIEPLENQAVEYKRIDVLV